MKHFIALTVSLLLSLPAFADDSATMAAEAWQHIEDGALLIDVRSAEEFEGGHIDGAINVPHDQTDALVAAIGADTDRAVVLYCGSGRRAGRAEDALEALGYQQVFNGQGYQDLVKAKP